MLERIFTLIESSRLSDSALCKELALGNGTIGKWRNGKQRPSLDAVIKLSSYFEVSLDYLVHGRQNIVGDSSDISPEERQWLTLINQLPREKQIEFRGELIGYLKALRDFQAN